MERKPEECKYLIEDKCMVAYGECLGWDCPIIEMWAEIAELRAEVEELKTG